jgi:hypothetical protein
MMTYVTQLMACSATGVALDAVQYMCCMLTFLF